MDTAVDTLSPAPSGTRRPDGRLEAVFTPDSEGRTFLARQYAGYPFHICRAQYLDPELPEMASLYLQSSAGGFFAGDCLSLDIAAEAGAKAHVTTPASTIVHRMPAGEAWQQVSLAAGPGSLLEYLPDPVILFPEARLSSSLRLRLGEGATAILADSFLAHDPAGAGEPYGGYASETEVVDAAGRLLLRDRFRIAGAEVEAGAAGVMGGVTMQGTVIAASDALDPGTLLAALRQSIGAIDTSVYGAASLLPNACGAWARLLAADGADLKDAVEELWSSLREAVAGTRPTPRRK